MWDYRAVLRLRFGESATRTGRSFRLTDFARVRGNSRTGAPMRLPQPRLVQTRLFALSRKQWGQIVFSNAMTFSLRDRNHATDRAKKEYAQGEKRTVAKDILYC
jgi:hypothetical protein